MEQGHGDRFRETHTPWAGTHKLMHMEAYNSISDCN